MAATTERRVHKIDDRTLYDTLRKISDLFPDVQVNSKLVFVPGVLVELEGIEDLDALAGRYVFSQASLNVSVQAQTNFSLNFYRSIKEGNARAPSARFDEFELNFASHTSYWVENQQLVAQILGVIGELDLPIAAGAGDDGTLRELILGFGASHRQMLAGLDSAIRGVEEKRVAAEEEFRQREIEREAMHQASLQELDAEREKLQLQSHMSERRKLLQAMTDERAASLRKSAVPQGAIAMRWGVFFAAILLSVLSSFFAYTSVLQLQTMADATNILGSATDGVDITQAVTSVEAAVTSANWYLIARSILSSLIAVGALAYAASWLRGFYNSDTAAAREVDRYNYDLTRASWVIETILEVQHEQKGKVPEAWIDGVTRGLFSNSGDRNDESDGTAALRALLGYTAAASFGPDGPKFEISQRQARRLAREAEGQDQ